MFEVKFLKYVGAKSGVMKYVGVMCVIMKYVEVMCGIMRYVEVQYVVKNYVVMKIAVMNFAKHHAIMKHVILTQLLVPEIQNSHFEREATLLEPLAAFPVRLLRLHSFPPLLLPRRPCSLLNSRAWAKVL